MTAFEQIKQHIESKRSFVLEAGAGSGKTYTLIQTLNYLIETRGKDIQNNHQNIVCITYTNVAKNEIIERLEYNPTVRVSTIHEFLWDCIKSYQKQLKIELCKLNEIRYNEELEKNRELTGAKLRYFKHKYNPNLSERISTIELVKYEDTAFRNFEKGQLHHDDVITLAKIMFESNILLTKILAQKYPFILVDEYQDTAEEIAIAFIDFLLERNQDKVVLGFYGDSHQKIYEFGVGSLEQYYVDEENKQIELVKKEENYRSSKAVVQLLNKFRTNIQQIPQKEVEGSVKFLYCNNPAKEESEKVTEHEKRIEPTKDENYTNVINRLVKENWDFEAGSKDKILIITNRRVAKRANFGELYQIYSTRYSLSTKDQLLDRNNSLIKHFTGYTDKKTSQEREIGIEHLVHFWESKNYNEVIRFLKKSETLLDGEFKHRKKTEIKRILEKLIELRNSKTIKEVFVFCNEEKILRQSDSLIRLFTRVESIESLEEEEEKERATKDKEFLESFLSLPYKQIINFFQHTQNNTVFSTKHGTKGAEYRNVLTVIDDTEWKQEYNFESFFDNTEKNEERKLRTRNLFYVECSRAKENLVVLALSDMNANALKNVRNWFGEENVVEISEYLKTNP